MSTSDTILTVAQKFEDLSRQVRKLRHSIVVMELDLKDSQPAEVIVAGIEGRTIVRAKMKRELRFIGEAE